MVRSRRMPIATTVCPPNERRPGPYRCRVSARSSAAAILWLLVAASGGASAFAPNDRGWRSPASAGAVDAAGERSADSQAQPGYVWPNGPPDDPNYFPIGVWLQSADNAAAYREIGINHFVGQWQGPTESQLAALTEADMPVIGEQNAVALTHLADPILLGWLQQDEPDNAQPDGQGGYGPCVDPAEIVARYEAMKATDPSRPVWLNLGQGVAHDYDRPYVGRGSVCASRWDQYPDYVRGADIVSFDIYPVTSPYDHIRGDLWRLAVGLDRLHEWTNGEKIVWNVIETAHIRSDEMPTPHQLRAEVWISLVHGSRGIVYFAHEWQPAFREAALLHYAETRRAVAAINAEIRSLAPVLNSPTEPDAIAVVSANAGVPVDTVVKRHGGYTYVIAVAMRDSPTRATFRFAGASSGRAEVIGEDRQIAVVAGAFEDDFDGYGVHLYRVRTPGPLGLPWLGR